MYKYLLLTWLIALCAFSAAAQQPDTSSAVKDKTDKLKLQQSDTSIDEYFKPKVKKEKEKVYNPDSLHSPHQAVIRSLLVPGLGQVYNRKYWKVPVIYAGLGLLGWAFVFNNNYYKEFLALSKYREHGIVPTPNQPYYTEYNLYAAQPSQAIYDANDSYRRDRDLSILGFVGAWGINCIDAYIDAKFIHSYTMDTNFTMKISPGLINQPAYAQNTIGSYIPGLKITFALK